MVATVYPHLWKPSPELPERGLTRGGGFYESGVVITDDEVDADGRVTVDVEFGEAERFVGLVRLWIARRGYAIVGGSIAPPCFVRKGDTFTINAGTIVLPWKA